MLLEMVIQKDSQHFLKVKLRFSSVDNFWQTDKQSSGLTFEQTDLQSSGSKIQHSN
jgi:hypothetical protein